MVKNLPEPGAVGSCISKEMVSNNKVQIKQYFLFRGGRWYVSYVAMWNGGRL